MFAEIRDAIAPEKQIKGGSRQKKVDLINGMNPEWRDLYEELRSPVSMKEIASLRSQ